MCKNKPDQTHGTCVHVEVNVTKIVKYVCITGIAIVGIIFGCSAWAAGWMAFLFWPRGTSWLLVPFPRP